MTQTAYLVDDNTSALQHNIITFKQAGIEVVGYNHEPLVALSELQGLHATGKSPDIICLDIIMPAMDGIELYRKLTAAKVPSRIVFVTALAAEGKFVGHFAKSIGGDKFLPKPLSVANLQQALALKPSTPPAEAEAKAEASPETKPPPPPPAAEQKPQANGQGEHIDPYGRDPKL